MLEKYRLNFASLSADESALVAGHVARRHDIEIVEEVTGEGLFDMCMGHGLGQADVVLACAHDPSPEAVVALEKLVGRPIVRNIVGRPLGSKNGVHTPRPPRPKGNAVRRSDPRRIVYVAEANPKKPGTAAHQKFSLYRVGMTVSEFVAAGGTMGDVNWDVERGFIRLEAPQ